jgi:hypothetical protein
MSRRAFSITLVALALLGSAASLESLLRLSLLPVSQAVPPPDAPGKYYGALTCDGASCHSKEKPREAPPALQEYTSWSYVSPEGVPGDRHSFAFKRLKAKGQGADPKSAAIMAELNKLETTSDTAETSERCLTCHGVSVHDYGSGKGGLAVGKHKELQGGKYKPEDGVSCDGCHGPAEKWLKPHEAKEWGPKKWKELGGKAGGSLKLYETFGIYYSKDLELWANQCIRCHLAIDTDLLDAGHPELNAFELFGQSFNVAHWRDYSAAPAGAPDMPAPGPFHAAASWQTGQAAALHAAATQLANRAKAVKNNKPTPARLKEAFDRAWSHWVVVRHAVKRVSPATEPAIEADMQALRKLVDEKGDVAAIAAGAEKVAAASKPLARAMADAPVDIAYVRAVMGEIAGDPADLDGGRTAEQAAKSLWALNYARLYATNVDALSANPPTEPVQKAVAALGEAPADPRNQAYTAALDKVKAALKSEK